MDAANILLFLYRQNMHAINRLYTFTTHQANSKNSMFSGLFLRIFSWYYDQNKIKTHRD